MGGNELAITLVSNKEKQIKMTPKTEKHFYEINYPYLANLGEDNFRALMKMLDEFGLKMLLGSLADYARWQAERGSFASPNDRIFAEQLAIETTALIERFDGLSELALGH